MSKLILQLTKILIPIETSIGERRVSATPETVKKLKSLGCDVYIEKSAGELSGFKDFSYEESGGITFDEQDYNLYRIGIKTLNEQAMFTMRDKRVVSLNEPITYTETMLYLLNILAANNRLET